MTKQEHDLMLTLFAAQLQMCGAIFELLKSRIPDIDSGDFGAYAALTFEEARPHVGKFFDGYCEAAKRCGVELPEGFASAG